MSTVVRNADLSSTGSLPGQEVVASRTSRRPEPRGAASRPAEAVCRALCCESVVPWSPGPGGKVSVLGTTLQLCRLFGEREAGREERGTRGRVGTGEVDHVGRPAWWSLVLKPSACPLTLRPSLPGGGPRRVWVGSEGRAAAPGPPRHSGQCSYGSFSRLPTRRSGKRWRGAGDRSVCTKPANWCR